MGAPGQNPRTRQDAGTNPTHQANLIRPAAPAAPLGRDSPSPPPASMARPADTAPGSCAPGPADNQTWSSRSTRSPSATATTGLRLRATTPGSSSATCPRSGTPPAPVRSAEDPPPPATLSTTYATKQAADRACVMAALNAAHNDTGCSSDFAVSHWPLGCRGTSVADRPRVPPQRALQQVSTCSVQGFKDAGGPRT